MKRSASLGAVVSMVLGNATLVIGQSTIYWGGNTANFTNGASWVGGVVPKNGNTGIIASGVAQVTTNNSLYNPGLGETAPAEISVQSGGTLQYYRYYAAGAASLLNHNLVLDGGTLRTDHPESSDYRYDHAVRVRSNSIMAPYMSRIDRSGQFLIYGELKDYDATHTGVLTKQEVGRIVLLGDVTFTGGWDVQAGLLEARTTNGVGNGNIDIKNGGTLMYRLPLSTDTVYIPNVTVQSNGTFSVVRGIFRLGPGKQFQMNHGAWLKGVSTGGPEYSQLRFPIDIAAGAVATIQRFRRNEFYFCDDFRGDATTRLDILYQPEGSEGAYYWYKTENAFCGSMVLYQTQTVYSNGVFGTGPVETKSGVSVDVKGDLTLRNVFSGVGTLKPDTGKTLTLQPCYRNSLLTDAGVAPGTNSGLTVGTLNVTGNLSFTNLPTYNGVDTAYSRAQFRMQVDPATVTGTGSMLKVTGNLNGLGYADLHVITPAGLPLGTYTIITAANNLSLQTFHNMTFSGQSAAVSYESGAVKLIYSAAAPLVLNGEATNIVATSATLSGYLTSTGSAETVVYVYWGTTDGGTNAGNWAKPPVNLGVRGVGPFTATVTPQADTRHYYRCYASNAVGTVWAPTSSSFLTPEDVSGYARRMKISFPGYDRAETLTNFPALVVLDESIPGFKYSDFVSANGYDLRFSNANGSKTLKYEIDTWNPAAKSWVWVQLDALATNSFIWAHWGNAATAASPALYTTNGATWSERYLSVWHLNGTNSAGKTLDATTNRFHGTVTACTNAAGQIAGAASFYADAANINVTGISYAGGVAANRNYTFYYWLSMTNMSRDARLIDITTGRLIMDVGYNGAGTATYYDGTWRPVAAGTNLNDGAWHHLVFVLNGSTLKGTIYKDGLAVGTNITYAPCDIGGNSHMGSEYDGAGTDYVGLMDEARIATVARSSNWVWACWMNQASNSVFSAAQFVSSADGTLVILR